MILAWEYEVVSGFKPNIRAVVSNSTGDIQYLNYRPIKEEPMYITLKGKKYKLVEVRDE